MSRDEFYGPTKAARAVAAKEVLILTGRSLGANFPELSELTGLDSSGVSRRFEAAQRKARTYTEPAYAADRVPSRYRVNIAASQV